MWFFFSYFTALFENEAGGLRQSEHSITVQNKQCKSWCGRIIWMVYISVYKIYTVSLTCISFFFCSLPMCLCVYLYIKYFSLFTCSGAWGYASKVRIYLLLIVLFSLSQSRSFCRFVFCITIVMKCSVFSSHCAISR